jgi:hypothetical protein
MKKIFILLVALVCSSINAMDQQDPKTIIDLIELKEIVPSSSVHTQSKSSKMVIPCVGSHFDSILQKALYLQCTYDEKSVTMTLNPTYAWNPTYTLLESYTYLDSESYEDLTLKTNKSDLFKLDIALKLLHNPKSTYPGCIIVTEEPIEKFKKYLNDYETQLEIVVNIVKKVGNKHEYQFPKITLDYLMAHNLPNKENLERAMKQLSDSNDNNKSIVIIQATPSNKKNLQEKQKGISKVTIPTKNTSPYFTKRIIGSISLCSIIIFLAYLYKTDHFGNFITNFTTATGN